MFYYFSLLFVVALFKPTTLTYNNNIGLLNYTFVEAQDVTNFLLQAKHLQITFLMYFHYTNCPANSGKLKQRSNNP